MLFGIISWILVGAIIGFVASRLTDLRGDDSRIGIGVSAIAGLIGGWLYSLISGSPVAGVSTLSADQLDEAAIDQAYALVDLEPDPAVCMASAEPLLRELAEQLVADSLARRG